MTHMPQARALDRLTLDDVVAVARDGAPVTVSDEVLAQVARGRAIVVGLADSPEPAYGVSTGFGALATVSIPPQRRAALQVSLIRSHAAGTGALLPAEVVRAMMVLRLRTLATGLTGVRPIVVESLTAMLNAGIIPAVREYGSLGCSGDLAPLAQVALAAMGEGDVLADAADPGAGTRPAAGALAEAGITALVYLEKEGLALINGTDGMLGMLALALADLDELLMLADITAAMTVEALLGTDRVFAADLQALRPQPGQGASAANLRALLADSPIMASHRNDRLHLVQDAYSLRCSPAVAGAARDTVAHARRVAAYELASTIDNPVVLPDGRVESNGNFHGAPVGYVLDFLAIAVADLASISERRIDKTLDRSRNQGLPPFLAHEVGVDSGYMIAQYAAAGIVSTLKRLAVPASVDSIPSSAMQEDHVAMGWAAGLKLRQAIDGLRRVLAIELMTSGRALDLRAPLQPAAGTGAALAALRTAVPGQGPDAIVGAQIEAAVALVESGAVTNAVVRAIGHLTP
ncbi:MAG: histidine ammonia-lyase [Actinomycetota bacterium]|nr:histidine ammonia-lyase [Actinomycetota bacterium]